MTSFMRPIALGLFLGSLGFLPAQADQPHWNYEETEHWGHLDKSFETCAAGHEQSPIDLKNAIHAELPTLTLDWKSQSFQIKNNGHTIQADAAPASSLMLAGKKFELKQFHFHTPSEHGVESARMPMEVHFVHAAPDGELAVIGVFLKDGGKNDTFSAIMGKAPRGAGGQPMELELDPKAFLPNQPNVFSYEGSLTTPPCSEVVNWIVYSDPITVAAADIAIFKSLYPMNARPLQARNRRYLLSGH